MKLRDMLQAYMPGFLITHADASITAENSFRVTSSVCHAVVRSVSFHRALSRVSPATSLCMKEADSCQRRAPQHWLEYFGVCAGLQLLQSGEQQYLSLKSHFTSKHAPLRSTRVLTGRRPLPVFGDGAESME